MGVQDGAEGPALLQGMVGDAKPLLISLTESLREVDPALKSQGESIYAQKPSLGANGVTWSQENYAHLGLQLECRLKSFQRFTETFAALERAYNAGIFGALAAAGGGRRRARLGAAARGGARRRTRVRAARGEVVPRRGAPPRRPSARGARAAFARPRGELEGLRRGLGFGFNVWDVNDGGGRCAPRTGGRGSTSR